jgi:antitoxin component of MazEF toxin-antitoxin module
MTLQMEGKVERWGRHLAIRLPDAVVKRTGFAAGQVVKVEVENGALVYTALPATQKPDRGKSRRRKHKD